METEHHLRAPFWSCSFPCGEWDAGGPLGSPWRERTGCGLSSNNAECEIHPHFGCWVDKRPLSSLLKISAIIIVSFRQHHHYFCHSTLLRKECLSRNSWGSSETIHVSLRYRVKVRYWPSLRSIFSHVVSSDPVFIQPFYHWWHILSHLDCGFIEFSFSL